VDCFGIKIDRKSKVPIYLQLKEHIKKMIEEGKWSVGKKIPTERELAEFLKVSRNTIGTAFRELEHEGILSSTQGKGTFVSDSDILFKKEGNKDRLLRIIDVSLEEAMELGFTIDEFLAITINRIKMKKEFLRTVKIALVECNKEQLEHFIKEINLGFGMKIIPVLLPDYRKDIAKTNKSLEEVDIVITTFFHLQEVKALLNDEGKEIIGIALNPHLETIVKIARLPEGKKVGVICLSNNFVVKVLGSLKTAGLEHMEFKTTITKDKEELIEFLQDLDAVIVSPTRKNEIQELIRDNVKIIEFRFVPDAGSINVLKTSLIELKKK